MKKQQLLLIGALSIFALSACSITTASEPDEDYVYTARYYSNPNWANRYYPRYQWSNNYWFSNRPLYGGSYGTGIYGRSW